MAAEKKEFNPEQIMNIWHRSFRLKLRLHIKQLLSRGCRN